VFTPSDRDRLRERLVSDARSDDRITGAALTGSTSVGHDDQWSDIDLAVSVAAGAELAVADIIGMGWLYALHARSSIERGRVWQAEYMISGVRDHVLALACVRHGVAASQGRGVDLLPTEVTEPMAATLVRTPDGMELRRAFRAVTAALLTEIGYADASLAERLTAPLRELAG
jgi:hypothetical protein